MASAAQARRLKMANEEDRRQDIRSSHRRRERTARRRMSTGERGPRRREAVAWVAPQQQVVVAADEELLDEENTNTRATLRLGQPEQQADREEAKHSTRVLYGNTNSPVTAHISRQLPGPVCHHAHLARMSRALWLLLVLLVATDPLELIRPPLAKPNSFLGFTQVAAHQQQQQHQGWSESNLKFDPQTSSYSGLTFTFDPRLDKQVEQRLHFEHWQQIMQQTSSLLYESLNGRAHLAEVQVLIPFKWRQLSAELRPVLYKPGAPIIANRRLRFTDSDVIVGPEDPIFKETPFAVQHDECGRPGLNIRMPISFLDHQRAGGRPALGPAQVQLLDSRLKARQLVREFASHRFGLFKESGFRSDFMYPPFSSVAGLELPHEQQSQPLVKRAINSSGLHAHHQLDHFTVVGGAGPHNATELVADQEAEQQQANLASNLRGFDEHFRECKFDTSPASGLPANAQAANCLPYLVRAPHSITSFNLMSSDPFSYADPAQVDEGPGSSAVRPVAWLDLAEQTKWHFCGENFANPNYAPLQQADSQQQQQQVSKPPGGSPAGLAAGIHFEHNQRATNKQNKMCHEKSALEVIRLSSDFRQGQQASSTGFANFNRLPAPNFKFLQEMPPRLIMAIEYTSHLFQSRRLDHAILESAINKFLALDLIAESELATVVFGQHQSRLLDTSSFQRLDSSLSSRLTLFNPALDPFDEQVAYFSQAELESLGLQSALLANTAPGAAERSNQQQQTMQQQQQQMMANGLKLLKGSCSFAKMMAEVNLLLAKSSQQYDDLGADLIVLTSGLFVEDETRIEEILRASNFRQDQNRLNLVLYPSSMLFDTKSRDGFIVLDSVESEQIIRARVNKLLTIQRLTGGRVHLIREQLDSNGDVRMSTLMQFYQVFDQLSRGHSWDQTNSLVMLASQQVDSRRQLSPAQQVAPPVDPQQQQQQHPFKLSFQFQLDESVQNELIVGFIDPKVQHNQPAALDMRAQHQHAGASSSSSHGKAGKRFSLRNLQLRSPNGQFVFTETNTLWSVPLMANQSLEQHQHHNPQEPPAVVQPGEPLESAFFPYRAQLSLAAFHVKPWHLAQLQAHKRLAGTWTLTATSDEPIQTSGLAMARVNPQGDTLTGSCWIQTYYQTLDSVSLESAGPEGAPENQQQQLRAVKVFMRTQGGAGSDSAGPPEVSARMEVQDEMGNIVQNVQMLDDGLGAPDMTQNDGVHSQYVQRASRSGFYKVSVELTTGGGGQWSRRMPSLATQSGQDNVCCGSFVPRPAGQQQAHAGRSTRQLYCGTFYVEPANRLAQQRPPRTSNLTVVNVDQENRRVTIRWFEPQVDISAGARLGFAGLVGSQRSTTSNGLVAISSDNDLQGEESDPAAGSARATRSLAGGAGKIFAINHPRRRQASGDSSDGDSLEPSVDEFLAHGPATQTHVLGSNVLMASHQAGSSSSSPRSSAGSGLLVDRIIDSVAGQQQQAAAARYDIKLFTDRDIVKRAFDSRQEVGFKFNEWSVEGQFPNATNFGGIKEVTLRVPFAREGFYYIAMKTYNSLGIASQMSNIVQFYLRNNLTLEQVESIYGHSGTTIDAEGNVYDSQGVLLQRAGAPGLGVGSNQLNSGYSLLRATSSLDGLSVLVLFSVLAFMMTILCISLVACLARSARHSLKAASKQNDLHHHHHHHQHAPGGPKKTISSIVLPGGVGGGGPTSAGSGSSVVSSSGGCESSEVGAGSASSSLAGSDQANQVRGQHQQAGELNNQSKLLFDEMTSYNKLRQMHKSQQQQAQLIHQQLISSTGQQQQQDFYSQPNAGQQQTGFYPAGPQHTLVNGYTYATVMQQQREQHEQYAQQQQQQQQQHYGDLNQSGLVMGHQQAAVDVQGLVPTSSAIANPVQSWPADILLSHYDKVKQARERNEAPPVMRIETLEQGNGLHSYADGLPLVFDHQMDQAEGPYGSKPASSYALPKQQQSAGATTGGASQQQQQQPPYFNQQLQQQLSSVLAGKRQSQEYDIDIRGTSPALEGVTGSELGGSNNNNHLSAGQQDDLQSMGLQQQQQQAGVPPPPQYIYCTPPGGVPIDTNGLGNQLTDPSIYSQTTNLQQVSSPNFYANHHQWSPSSATGGGGGPYGQTTGGSNNIYAAAMTTAASQDHGDSAISEV